MKYIVIDQYYTILYYALLDIILSTIVPGVPSFGMDAQPPTFNAPTPDACMYAITWCAYVYLTIYS